MRLYRLFLFHRKMKMEILYIIHIEREGNSKTRKEFIMLYHTIQKFSDADDKISKSVGIPLRDIRECILDLMESYEKSFDDV